MDDLNNFLGTLNFKFPITDLHEHQIDITHQLTILIYLTIVFIMTKLKVLTLEQVFIYLT